MQPWMTRSANSCSRRRLHRLGIEREFEHVGGLDQLRRARARQQKPAGIVRMAQADMAEGVEHALVGEHAACKRDLVAGSCEAIGHARIPCRHCPSAQRAHHGASKAASALSCQAGSGYGQAAPDAELPGADLERMQMNPVVAVIAPGMMGGAVGGRLVENGLKVLDLARRPQRRNGGAREEIRAHAGERRGDRGGRFHPLDPAAGGCARRWRSASRRR